MKLNEIGCEVNARLTEIHQEKKLYSINHLKKVKPNNLNRGKLHFDW